MGQVQQRIGKVKRCHHFPQRHRSMAIALRETESRMRRTTGYQYLLKFKQALKNSIPNQK